MSASALALGFIHGLGADHLMAIAALSVQGPGARPRVRIVRTALQFACGHTLMLGAGALIAMTTGWILPAAMAGGAERIGGALLIALGAAGLWSTLNGTTYGHIHAERDGRSRWHVHFGAGAHRHQVAHPHSTVPTLMGAVFAVSSLRALVLIAPMGTSVMSLALPATLVLVLLFGFGILLSMSLFGVVLARVLSLRGLEALGRIAACAVGVASVGLGVYWLIA